jgi:hypothetical protein
MPVLTLEDVENSGQRLGSERPIHVHFTAQKLLIYIAVQWISPYLESPTYSLFYLYCLPCLHHLSLTL